MRYLYTTKPDEHCREVEPGIWGRPAHTSEQPKLRKKGWAYNINELRGADHVQQGQEEGRKEAEEQVAEEMAKLYEEVIGKKPHHKMKFDTMKAKIDEALKDV